MKKHFYDYLDVRGKEGEDIPAPVAFCLKLMLGAASAGMITILVLSNL